MNGKGRLILTIITIFFLIALGPTFFNAMAQAGDDSKVTVTETKYTTITTTLITGTRTLATTITHTYTDYVTRTSTITYIETITRTTTVTGTITLTTTATVTPGPNIVIDSLTAAQPEYRPGQYVVLRIGFKNIGDKGDVKVCYGVHAPYLHDRWITKCKDLGYMGSEDTKYVTDGDTVFATCEIGGCSNMISVKVLTVNNKPPLTSSAKSIWVNVKIDEEITLDWTGPGVSQIITGLRKNEVRSYSILIRVGGVTPLFGRTYRIELTVKRLDGGLFDWDQTVDLLLNHAEGPFDEGGLCYPNEPIRIGVNKGFKKFELTWVNIDGTISVAYPGIIQSDFQRVGYTAEAGFRFPWDSDFYRISKICVWES